jgi:Uma2 family endonuclease
MMQQAMIPKSFLEERRRLGHDRFDEVWDGVLHMVPFPSPHHQRLEHNLAKALEQIAVPRGLTTYHGVGLYNPTVPGHKDYRGPDIVVVEERHVSKRGIEGAAHIAIEIRSPDDESYEKLPFYAKVGVREVWIIDQAAKTIEVYVGERQVAAVGGVVHAPALGLELSISGNRLKLKDGTTELEVDLG